MKTALAACILSLLSLPWIAGAAWPHSWYTAQKNAAGQGCCGGQDCAEIPYESVRCDATGCTVTLRAGEHPMLHAESVTKNYNGSMYGGSTYGVTTQGIGTGAVEFRFDGFPASSPDGKAHACFTASDVTSRRVRCLFYGGAM